MALREVPCLLAAAVLHLAIPVAAEWAPVPLRVRPLLAGHLRPTEVLVDVAVERIPVPWPRDLPPEAFPIGDPRRIAHHMVPRDRAHLLPPIDPTSHPMLEPPVLDVPPDGVEPQSEYDYDAPPVLNDVTGTWGWPTGPRSWALAPGGLPVGPPSDAAPTRTRPRRAVDRDIAGKVITRAIQKKDRTLGLDLPAASAVASVVGGAVRAADTPNDCVARVAVTLGSNGKVQGVSVLTYSGGSGGVWKSVERSIRAQLASRTFSMRSAFAKGAIVTVHVRSRLRMPSGSGGRKGLGLTFDPTNIGARPSRFVTTSVSVQPVR